jgi:hypothetical protein
LSAVRGAAVLFAFTGLGFGLPCINGIRSLAAGRGVPLLFGFPAYGHGTFERHGVPSTVPMLLAFMIVCALEVVAASLLWQGRASGAVLGLILLPPGALFWIGFDLPIPPILAVVRTVLLVTNWDQLS